MEDNIKMPKNPEYLAKSEKFISTETNTESYIQQPR